MSQEKAKTKTKDGKDNSETRKKILLGVLFLALIVVFYIQFFSGEDSAPSATTVAVSNPVRKPSPTAVARALRPGEKPEPIITQPLQFAWFERNISGTGTGRNIFVYPTPTPEPPPPPMPVVPPPPPPPILLSSVNPSGVIGRTGAFVMTIYGDKFPADAQGFLDGRPYPTKVMSQSEVRVQIPAEAIRLAGNLGIQVRSVSDAQMYSNQLSMNVAEPPAPAYHYVGLISNKNGMLAVLKSQADENEVQNVRKGEKFGTHWRVVNIRPDKIEVEDTNIKIVHVINFSGESK